MGLQPYQQIFIFLLAMLCLFGVSRSRNFIVIVLMGITALFCVCWLTSCKKPIQCHLCRVKIEFGGTYPPYYYKDSAIICDMTPDQVKQYESDWTYTVVDTSQIIDTWQKRTTTCD